MTTTPKDKAEILSNPQDFQAAYLRAVEFFGKNPSVVSVGFGQKHSRGSYQDDIAIIVFVREKKKDEALSPEERIPASFEGYKTDVVVVPDGSLMVCENTGEYPTIQGGIQIVPKVKNSQGQYAEGTLGCIVHRRGDSNRENVFLLTCRHVLFVKGSGPGDYVYHPFAPPPPNFGSPGPSNSLGAIQEGAVYANLPYTYKVNNASTTTTHFLDCGVAQINLDSICCDSTCTKDTTKVAPSIIDLGLNADNTMADVRDAIIDPLISGAKVFKVGRTTGLTIGRVKRVTGTVNLPTDPDNPNSPRFNAVGMIEIDLDVASMTNGVNCKGLAWFSDKGDSGALVLDEQARVIGLVSAGPLATVNGQPNTAPGPTFACHILPVLDHLNICIPCTPGTSHGSSLATDGSGIKPTALPPDQSTLPVGKFVFTPAREDAAPERPARPFTPMPVTDDEARHMRELLAEFRDTRLGPQLHASFAEVRREIGYLVRNSRPVKVAWIRNRGPAFFAHVLNHLAGHADRVPHEVQGVTRRALLVRMREVLSAHGSNPLREALERYGDDLLEMLTRDDCDGVADCIAWMQERVPA